MSTRVDLTHVEIPNRLHAILRRISDKTGIKINRLAGDLITVGLTAKCSAKMVARSGVTDEVKEAAK